jgi:hypothetical protein
MTSPRNVLGGFVFDRTSRRTKADSPQTSVKQKKNSKSSNGMFLNIYPTARFVQSMQSTEATVLASATGMEGRRRRCMIPLRCKVRLKGACMS